MNKNNQPSRKKPTSPSTESTPSTSGPTHLTSHQEYLDATPDQRRLLLKKALIKGLTKATAKKLPEPTHKGTHEEALREIREMNKELGETTKEGIKPLPSSEEEK